MRGNGKAQHRNHMKKNSCFLILLFAASVIFTGCRSNDDPEPEYIVIDDGAVYQNVYADEVAGESGIRFTTLAPWTSSVTEDWVSINPASGGTGTHNIVISLTPNFTGNDRTAIIAITSGGTTIEIRITQQGKTEGGEIPKEPFVIVAENVGGDDTGEVVAVQLYAEIGGGSFMAGEAPFQNNGFILQPTNNVPKHALWSIIETGVYEFISDKDANLGEFAIDALDNNGNVIGFIDLFAETEDKFYISFWIYADRDVTIRGTYRENGWEQNWDVDFRRGWNAVYQYWCKIDDNEWFSTQRPNDVNFIWEFHICCCASRSRSATTRVIENRRSIF